MKLREIHIENFKSIKALDLTLHPDINVIIGKNNVGKSNLLDCIPFVSSLVTAPEEIEKNFTDGGLGTIGNLVYGKTIPSRIAFRLVFSLSAADLEYLSNSHETCKMLLANSTSGINLLEYYISINGINYKRARVFSEGDSEHVALVLGKNRIVIADAGRFSDDRSVDMNAYQYRALKFDPTGASGQSSMTGFGNLGSRYNTRSLINYILNYAQSDEWYHYPILMLYDYMQKVRKLNATRDSSGVSGVQGISSLSPNGSNLVQVLNSLSSSDRATFDKILSGLTTIVGEIAELKAPLMTGQASAYLSTVESTFPGKEFAWASLPNGIKEILFVLTALYTTPKGGFIAIEEPEIHMHWDALVKLTALIKKIATEDDKQIMIATHSPTIVDNSPLEKKFVIVREAGQTKYVPLGSFHSVGEALDAAGIPYSWLLLSKQPRYILVLEGRDDNKVWRQFLKRGGLDLDNSQILIVNGIRRNGGGKDEAILTAKLLMKIRAPVEWKLILDSDNSPNALDHNLEGLPASRVHILKKKELESYLIDASAIAKLTTKDTKEVEKAIEDSKRAGKEQLDDIFERLGLSKPNENVKELLALQIQTLDDEILKLSDEISNKVPK